VTPIPESECTFAGECTFADAEVVPAPDLRALETANAALIAENARLKAALREAEGKGGRGPAGGWVSISRVPKESTSGGKDCPERTSWPLPADIDAQYTVRPALLG
jgi:hypothetical protein